MKPAPLLCSGMPFNSSSLLSPKKAGQPSLDGTDARGGYNYEAYNYCSKYDKKAGCNGDAKCVWEYWGACTYRREAW